MTESLTQKVPHPFTTGLGPVVLGVDAGASSDAATLWAARTAERWGVPLVLLQTYGPRPPEPFDDDLTLRRTEAAAAERLRAVCDDVLDVLPGLEIERRPVEGEAGPALVKAASTAGLVVVGSHGRGVTGRLVLGSVSHAVATRSRTPVAVVREAETDPHLPVVLGVELPGISADAVEFAAREAQLRDVPLVLVHSWHLSGPYGYAEVGPDGGALAAMQEVEETLLAQAVAEVVEAHPGLRVEGRAVVGSPSVVLADAAAGAQLLVVGTHSRNGMGRLVLGSVSTNVLHAVPTPVVVVPNHRRP